MEWSCKRANGQIMVFYGPYHKGNYLLLEEPYCKICAHPDVETESCTDHYDLDGFERIYAMGRFIKNPNAGDDSLLSRHIWTLKKNASHARPLGRGLEIVVKELYPELLKSTMIVPIPQHPDKLFERGFNQSLELSNVVGECFNLPVEDVLRKTQNIDMRPMGREERRLAVEEMYVHGEKCSEIVDREKIMIIDDVVTTGFTVAKCARLLKEAGAKDVNVLVAGRTV
jgi:predicted amidophosphoribosyltransferase